MADAGSARRKGDQIRTAWASLDSPAIREFQEENDNINTLLSALSMPNTEPLRGLVFLRSSR